MSDCKTSPIVLASLPPTSYSEVLLSHRQSRGLLNQSRVNSGFVPTLTFPRTPGFLVHRLAPLCQALHLWRCCEKMSAVDLRILCRPTKSIWCVWNLKWIRTV